MKVGRGALVLAGAAAAAQGQSGPSESTVPVTVDNFHRAESDMFFGMFIRRSGIGQFYHHREPPPLDAGGVRPNRDPLYSEAVFDLDAGPVTITLPEAAGRYMVLQIVDEDHYAQDAIYAAGDHTFTRQGIGTRYILAAVRTLVDPADPQDVAAVHAFQDAIRFQQPGGPGALRGAPLGRGESEDGSRCAAGAQCHFAGSEASLRPTRSGRSRAAPHRYRVRVGRQSGPGCHLSHADAGKERRQRGVQAHGQGRAGRRLLVDQRL